jgi:antitoxin YefM
MPQKLTITQARDRLTQLPEQFSARPELGAIAVTRRGEPIMALMSWELYEAITETLDILGDPEQADLLRRGIQDVSSGRTVAWDEVKAELGL